MECWNQAMDVGEWAALRSRAVQAVLAGDKKIAVARRYGITRQTLHNWVTRHRLGGAEALRSKPRGRARRLVLETWQEAQVAGAIRIVPPWTVNPRYTRWTKRAIAEYVERSFGVLFSTWQVDSHLRTWGFDSHKDVRRAFLDNPARAGSRSLPHPTPVEATLRDLSAREGGVRA